tara:strand:+ start:13391 stop:13594 length:204 start_codon:yes stop_codon:yes gene_type:complete
MTRQQLNAVLKMALKQEAHPNTVFRMLGSEAFEERNGSSLSDEDLVDVTQQYLVAYGQQVLGMTFKR